MPYKKCCRPYKKDQAHNENTLRKITAATVLKAKIVNITMSAGDYICMRCRLNLHKACLTASILNSLSDTSSEEYTPPEPKQSKKNRTSHSSGRK
jgi:hypothetical protein